MQANINIGYCYVCVCVFMERKTNKQKKNAVEIMLE